MPDYHRFYFKGATYFFTVVTYNRNLIFKEKATIDLLKYCMKDVKNILDFSINAIVILPDHLHTIWTLPENDADFSTRWKLIKSTFSKQFKGSNKGNLPESMNHKGEIGVWQRRFWEHLIRDEEDFNRHCDYIHYNPVKHNFVKSPPEWKYSSFEKFVRDGIYEHNWGQFIDKSVFDMDLE